MDKTIRRVTDFKAQREETYRYWQTCSIAERMEAVAQIIRNGYALKGIDLDKLPNDRTLIRVVNRTPKVV